jgi:hypothetical protein
METGDVYNACLQLKKDIEKLINDTRAKLKDGSTTLEVHVTTIHTNTQCGSITKFEVTVAGIISPD